MGQEKCRRRICFNEEPKHHGRGENSGGSGGKLEELYESRGAFWPGLGEQIDQKSSEFRLDGWVSDRRVLSIGRLGVCLQYSEEFRRRIETRQCGYDS